jgi:hypothetical protein
MTIPMDVLNQIALIIRNDRGQAMRLRNLLIELSSLPTYRKWLDEGQFAGRGFRLPRDFISAETSERRLLESVRLVVDDILQVKIHYVDGRFVFITDGLFVPADFRVSPWSDESDRLIEACRRLGWSDWPTVVIDLAMGCGHNSLRLDAGKRFGFDMNMRSLGFATVNSLLNDRPFSLIAISDVRLGIPSLTGQPPERVLFLVNMPFALEPVPGALVRTAAGGENGYEQTVAALSSIQRFASQVARGTKIRALVLAYSVGNREKGLWVVEQRAKKLFSLSAVTWTILEGERLWRINGKKEQPNPMPLSSLKLKADCRYYVRDERLREPLRAGYVKKERELKRQGFDSLAYGVLHIEVAE